jgi:Flp pilus assembly protein TadG
VAQRFSAAISGLFSVAALAAEVGSRRRMPNANIPAHNRQRGIIILLVAVVLLFVVGAMAALSIDVVTFYTARSEAQLAADAAALAGARVLANSGFTSTSAIPSAAAEALATNVANQIATSSKVAGRTLNLSEIKVSYPNVGAAAFATNPHITVAVTRTDIPTFFARIWGRTAVTVQASATAEAYNPSGVNALDLGVPVFPVAPTCVKPWILPNMSPTDPSGNTPIIDRTTGAILTPLIGQDISAVLLMPVCSPNCNNPNWWTTPSLSSPSPWKFYPGAQPSFPAPTSGLPSCADSFNAYQQSVAGCVERPIVCGSTVEIDTSPHSGLRNQTDNAVNCLTNNTNNEGDSVDMTSFPPSGPYRFLTGNDNPLVQAGSIPAATDVMVSDSLVTVLIFDNGVPLTSSPTVIGFVQLFLNQNGYQASGQGISTQSINIAGCGTGVPAVQPILGNGASPVPVRLITPP